LLIFSATAFAQADRSRKVHNPAADAKGCTRLVANPPKPGGHGGWQFVNNCPTAARRDMAGRRAGRSLGRLQGREQRRNGQGLGRA